MGLKWLFPVPSLTEKSHAFHMQIMRGIAHHFHMYNTDIHTQKPCCHTGMQITNVSSHAKHIQSTQKTHGNCGRKSCGKKLQKSRHMQSTCNHMVITGGSHVDAKYEFLVTCGHMVTTGGSHVEANYKFLVSRIAHVKHMKNHVTTR